MLNKTASMRFIKFSVVGGSGVIVNAGLLWVFTEVIGLDYRISSIVAIFAAIANNFLWNYLWTWRDRRTRFAASKVGMLLRFYAASGAVAMIVNWGLLVLLTEYAGLNYQVANLIGILCGTLINFLASHYWAFSANE